MKKALILILFSVSLLVACNDDLNYENRNLAELFKPLTQSSILFINPFSGRLTSYNIDTNTVDGIWFEENFFFYGYSVGHPLYTAGHSMDLGFKIIEVTENGVTTLFEVEDNQGIFPLAYCENTFHFILAEYDELGNVVSQIIVKYDITRVWHK